MEAERVIIGFAGYAGSGKDEAAKALVEMGWRRDAFADRMKDFLLAVDPIIPSPIGLSGHRLSHLVRAWGWDDMKRAFPEVRELLQRLGTEAGRRLLGEDLWVDALFRDYWPDENMVISDVRFPNELTAIQLRGGVVLRVRRYGIGPARDENGAAHESEVALDGWGLRTVHNNGTINDLHEEVRNFVARLA
jgi:hypothetical protein